jgi:hypothetical protein
MALSLCSRSVANVGELACDVAKGVLKKLFIFNGTISGDNYATEAQLLALMAQYSKLSKDAANKIFPLNEIQDIADASEANTEGTLGLGFKAVLREGKPAYALKLFAGSDLLKRLRTFNNQTIRVFEYDANGRIWGTKQGSNFIGYQVQLFFTGGHVATGANVEEKVVTVTMSVLSTSEYIDNSYFATIGNQGNIEDIKALNDVQMSKLSNASNVHKIAFKIPGASLGGSYDIWGDFGSLIATQTFTARTGANFATTLLVTSVAADNALGALTVTFDSTAYTGLTNGALIKLIPPAPDTLDIANITNVEILPLIISKTA